MKGTTLKAILTAAWTALFLYLQQLAVPVIVLFAVVCADYITGMLRACQRRELSSRRGLFGILKKLCYFLVVGVGTGVDWLLSMTAEAFSFPLRLPFAVGMLVAVWLIINELISILENLTQIGVPMPAFLARLVRRLKISAEQAADASSADSSGQGD